jgi:DNA adenine methylase
MLPYIGNKVKLSPFILRNLPPDESWNTFIEPFGGMYSTYFSLFRNDIKAVYNDINPLNYNLFLCMKDPAFADFISEIPTSEKLYYQYQSEITDIFTAPNFEMAMRWAYVLANSLSQQTILSGSFRAGGWQAYKIHINQKRFSDKIANISDIEGLDFIDCINKYDSENTLFYVDPPYFNTENYYHFHNFDRQRHRELSNILSNIDGKFCLSYYYNRMLEELYPTDSYRWEWHTRKGTRDEILIMNY